MELAEIVAGNLQRICKEHDLSSNELANRSGMPQKTIYTMIQGTHQCRIDNLEKISKALLVSPTSLVTPHLPTNVLMSRRLPRLIDRYAKLSMEDRERAEAYIDSLAAPEAA
jgi:DNA-binding Xre family transcriptional regulator